MGIREVLTNDLLQTGPEVLASAATIAPTTNFVRVTGNTTIGTITPPEPRFRGPLYLMNSDSSVGIVDTSGNCILQFTITRYKIFTLMYDPTTSKWYPSATS